MSLAAGVGDGLHVKGFYELQFVHETSQGESPAFRDGGEVLQLVQVQVDKGEGCGFCSLFLGRGNNQVLINNWFFKSFNNFLFSHVLKDESC